MVNKIFSLYSKKKYKLYKWTNKMKFEHTYETDNIL